MVDTFRLMNQIRLDKYQEISQEDLAVEYQATNNQSIIAEIFCRNFKLLCSVIYEARYNLVEQQDKVDSAVCAVYRALDKFDVSRNLMFNTFLIKNVRSNLATHMAKIMQKRHCQNMYSLDEMKENTDNHEYEKNFQLFAPKYTEQIDLSVDLSKTNLSEREKIMCEAIMENPNISNTELSEILKCHRHTVRNEKYILQQKLAFLLN